MEYTEGGPAEYWRARAEKAEAAEALQRGLVAGYKDRAEKAEAERDTLAAALSQAREAAFDEAVRAAEGSLNYGGGYRRDEPLLDIYHHGIKTVANVLRGRRDNPEEYQTRVLLGIADDARKAEARRLKTEGGRESLRHAENIARLRSMPNGGALTADELAALAETWEPEP